MEILGKTSIDFIGKRHMAYGVSAVLIVLGIVALIQITRGAANMGIDFAGGTSIQVKFERPVDLGAVREALSKNGIKDSEPQQFADGRTIMVRLKRGSGEVAGTADLVQNALRKEFGDNPLTVEASTEVGPAIGRELQQKALLAAAISLAGIIIYIAWRFEFRFGVAATIASGGFARSSRTQAASRRRPGVRRASARRSSGSEPPGSARSGRSRPASREPASSSTTRSLGDSKEWSGPCASRMAVPLATRLPSTRRPIAFSNAAITSAGNPSG